MSNLILFTYPHPGESSECCTFVFLESYGGIAGPVLVHVFKKKKKLKQKKSQTIISKDTKVVEHAGHFKIVRLMRYGRSLSRYFDGWIF